MYENQKEGISTTDEYPKKSYEQGQKTHYVLKEIKFGYTKPAEYHKIQKLKISKKIFFQMIS